MKSGTTLLRKLLGLHPNIFAGLETHWFNPEFKENWQDLDSKRQVWLRNFFEVPLKEVESIKKESTSAVDFIDKFMWHCAHRENKKRWVEKTPDNIIHLELIREHWPEAKVIHLVRDYRDVFASWKKNRDESISDYIEKVQHIMNSLGELVGSQNEWYCEVSYNELVSDSQGTMRKVLEFLDEPWSEDVISFQGDNWDHEKILEVTGIESRTTKSLSKPIFTSSIEQWREVLSSEEVNTIEQELAPYMSIWGWQ